jgi:hypothetical protein
MTETYNGICNRRLVRSYDDVTPREQSRRHDSAESGGGWGVGGGEGDTENDCALFHMYQCHQLILNLPCVWLHRGLGIAKKRPNYKRRCCFVVKVTRSISTSARMGIIATNTSRNGYHMSSRHACEHPTRSRIHEHTISLRFPGIILRVLDLRFPYTIFTTET